MKLYYKTQISAAHSIPNCGKCSQLHGHTWTIEVNIYGETHDGMIVDFREIKKIIHNYDHKNLNEILAIPTAEIFCKKLFAQLNAIKNVCKATVRVWESDHAYAEME